MFRSWSFFFQNLLKIKKAGDDIKWTLSLARLYNVPIPPRVTIIDAEKLKQLFGTLQEEKLLVTVLSAGGTEKVTDVECYSKR